MRERGLEGEREIERERVKATKESTVPVHGGALHLVSVPKHLSKRINSTP